MNEILLKCSSPSEWLKLAQDPLVLAGGALLLFSLVGFLWILKSLHKQSGDVPALAPSPKQRVSERTEKQMAPQKNSEETEIKNLSQTLNRIEENLKDLSQKLKELSLAKKIEEKSNKIEFKSPSNQTTEKSGEMVELLVKVDKIYQVLASLSETAER